MIDWEKEVETFNAIYNENYKSGAEMLEDLHARYTLDQIAECLFVSVPTLVKYMKLWGKPRRPKGWSHLTNNIKNEFLRMDTEDLTVDQIAESLECTERYVHHLARESGKKYIDRRYKRKPRQD